MSVKEISEVQYDSTSVLNEAVGNVVEMLKNNEEEEEKLAEIKENLNVEIEIQKRIIHQLELEKAEIDAEITTLKLRNVAYQKEHTNLRNAIKVVKFQIENIKESIAKAKENDLRDLEEFEKTIDDITEKFRSGPDIYDRKILQEKIRVEKEKKEELLKKLNEVKDSYEDFNKEKGLRTRMNENEELLNCVLPGSEFSCLIEMTNTLAEVISQIKKLCRDVKQEGDLLTAHDS